MSRLTLACHWSLCALAPALSAQGTVNPPGSDLSYQLLVTPPELPTDLFQRGVAGDFDADLSEDCAVMKGDKAKIVIGPGLFESTLTLPGNYHDLDRLPPSAGAGATADRLLVVGASGLQVLEEDLSTLSLLSNQGIWADASFVRVGDVDGDGGVEIVGVRNTAAGISLSILAWDGNAWSESTAWSAAASLARDVVLMDEDGDGDDDVALLTGSGVEVFDEDGSLLAGYANTKLDAIGRIAIDGMAGDQLLTVTRVGASPVQYLLVVYSPTSASLPIVLGDVGVSGLSTGHWGTDGYEDCVLSLRSTTDLWILRQQPITPASSENPFSLTGGGLLYVRVEDGDPAPDNEARPALADFDNDGDPDLVQQVQETSTSFLLPGLAEDEREKEPEIANITYNDSTGDLRLTLNRADLKTHPGADEVEVLVWQALYDPQASTYETVPAGVLTLHAADSQQTFLFNLSFPGPTNGGPIYYIVVRYVDTDAGGNVSLAYPGKVYWFLEDGNTLGGVYVSNELLLGSGSTVQDPDGARVTGGYGPANCIPDFPPDMTPAPGPTNP